MKVRPIVDTSTMRNLLQGRLDKYNEQLGQTKSKLEDLQKPGILYNPVDQTSGLKTEIEYLETDIRETKDKLIMIDAHSAPRVAVEFEL